MSICQQSKLSSSLVITSLNTDRLLEIERRSLEYFRSRGRLLLGTGGWVVTGQSLASPLTSHMESRESCQHLGRSDCCNECHGLSLSKTWWTSWWFTHLLFHLILRLNGNPYSVMYRKTFYNIKIFIKFEHIPGTRTMVLMSRKNYLMTLIYRILNL